jgi:hypothetical protein
MMFNLSLVIDVGMVLAPHVTNVVTEAIASDAEGASDAALDALVALVDDQGHRIPVWSKFPESRRRDIVRWLVGLMDAADDAARGDFDGDGTPDKVPVKRWIHELLTSPSIDLRTWTPAG